MRSTELIGGKSVGTLLRRGRSRHERSSHATIVAFLLMRHPFLMTGAGAGAATGVLPIGVLPIGVLPTGNFPIGALPTGPAAGAGCGRGMSAAAAAPTIASDAAIMSTSFIMV
jgi:hypothetical protein